MSSVDERIVRMKFDNAQFEKGVEESLGSIDRLNKKLDSTESATAFEGISKAANNVDMSGIEKAVDHISDRFSIFGTIATTVLVNIANQAFQTGEALIKSLSTDNIVAGWEKYDQEVQAVQTIMVTLGDTTTMKEVEDQLEKLSWYSDETSYSYTQMTDALAKFISSGMDMEGSVTAVMGLANAAAAAGVNTQTASRAFYNFSQAMGAGYMSLLDWRSIENITMGTPAFKQNIIDSAVALGKLKTMISETGETMYYVNKKSDAFTVTGMASSLKDKWFDQEVMLDVLKRYGEFSDQVHDLQKKYGYDQASSVISDADKLGLALDTFSAKAFLAGQEAKTFAEAIDATKDAVSTKWKNTFEYIFGNYEEAKVLWTDFSEFLYELFASSGDERNDLLKEWKELGGRDDLIEGFYNIMESILNIINTVKDAWKEIFPPMTAQQLVDITKGFRNLTERLKFTENDAENLKKVLTPIFKVIRFIVGVIKEVFTQIKRLGPPIQGLINKFKEILGPIWDKLVEVFKNSSLFSSINTDGSFVSKIVDFLSWCINKITEGVGKLQEFLGPIWTKLKDRLLKSDLFSKFNTDGSFLTTLANLIAAGFGKIKEGINSLKDIKIDWSGLTNLKNRLLTFKEQGLDVVSKGAEVFSTSFDKIKDTLQTTLSSISGIFRKSDLEDNVNNQNQTIGVLQGVWEKFLTTIAPITTGISGIINTFVNGLQNMKLGDILGTAIIFPLMIFIFRMSKLVDGLSEGFEGIADVFSGVSKILKARAREYNSKALLNFIGAIGILVAAIVVFSNFVDNANLDKAIVNIGGLIVVLLVVMGLMNKLSTMLGRGSPGITWSKNGISFNGFGSRTGLIALAVSVLAIVLAIKFMYDIISQDNAEELVQKVANMMFIMVATLGIIGGLLTAVSGPTHLGLQTFYPLVLVTSILLMIRVLKKLNELQIDDYTKVIVGILGIVTVLVGVSKLAGKTAMGARAIISIASSLLIVAIGLNVLNKAAQGFTWKSAVMTAFVLGIMALIVWASTIVDKASEVKIIQKGEKFTKQGSAILKIALGMVAVVMALRLLQKFDWGTILKAVVLFGVVMGLLIPVLAVSKAAGDAAGKTIKSLGTMVTTMSLAISLLSLVLKFSPAQVVQASIIMAGLLLVIAGALRIVLAAKSGNVEITTRFVVALSTLMGILAGLLVAFYFFDDKGRLFKAAAILGVLFLSVAAVIHVLTRFSGDVIKFQSIKGAIGILILTLAAIAGTVFLLSESIRDADQLPKAALAIIEISVAMSILLVAFSAFAKLLGAAINFNIKAMVSGVVAFVSVLILIIGSLIAASRRIDFNNLKNLTADFALGLLAFIGVVMIITALASLIGLIPFSLLGLGIAKIAIIISLLGGVALAIASWNKNVSESELEEFLQRIYVLKVILTAVAQMLSQIIGYLFFGWLPILGEQLSAFSEALIPFSDAISKFPDDFNDKVVRFGQALLSLIFYLSIADGLDEGLLGIKAAESGGVLSKFVKKLVEVSPDLVTFFNNISQITVTDKTIELMESFSRLFSAAPTASVMGFGFLVTFATDVRDFFDYIGFISEANIDTVNNIADLLETLSSDKIDYSKFDADMAGASYNLSSFAQYTTILAQNLTNPQLFKIASETAPHLIALCQKFSSNPQAFTFLSFSSLNNDENTKNLGERLKNFAAGIWEYAKALKDMKTEDLVTASTRTSYITSIITQLATAEKEISPNKIGGIIGWFKEYPDLGKFVKNVADAIPNIKAYIDAIGTGINYDTLSTVEKRTELVSSIISSLGTASSNFSMDNSSKLKNLASILSGDGGLASKIIAYSDEISSYEGDIYKAATITSRIANAITALTHADRTADMEAFTGQLKRMVSEGLDEWLEVFKEWPQQDKLNQAVQEFTDGVVTAFNSSDNSQKISESLLTPINNLLKSLNAKGINFYNTGHNLTQQLLNGLNSLKLEYKSSLEEIKNIPTSILDTVSSEDVASSSALSFMADQLRDLTGAAQEAKETVPTALEEVLTTTKELGVNVETGQNGRGLSDWISDLKNKVGLNIDPNQILDTLGLNYESFDLTNAGALSGETYSSGFMQGLLSNMSPETLDYTAYVDQFMSEMQASLDQYGLDTGGLTVDVMPVLSDGSTIADFEGIMGDMYGPNIQYNTDAITNLTEKVTVLNTKLDSLTSALNNQTIKHEGTINVKYTNQQGLVDSVTRAIIDNLRVGGRI